MPVEQIVNRWPSYVPVMTATALATKIRHVFQHVGEQPDASGSPGVSTFSAISPGPQGRDAVGGRSSRERRRWS